MLVDKVEFQPPNLLMFDVGPRKLSKSIDCGPSSFIIVVKVIAAYQRVNMVSEMAVLAQLI